MKKYVIFLVSFVLVGANLFAQNKIKPELVPNHFVQKPVNTKNDTLKILAVMVQFKPDKYDATFGDGTFGSIYSGDNRTRTDIIDPLPHDKFYFENHLKFVKNYFEKESFGKLKIEYHVLDNIIQLDTTMRFYSPEVNSSDFTPIANMTKEAWEKAYAENPNFNFGDYDMFVVFHAGVGRDVSLPGSLGLERDIPSIYFNLNQYREVYDDNFDGINVGNFKITNSAVLPETESREIAGLSSSVLIELSINGLLASMVGSYLGLPDLYNTETGLSAIGRFGLMDGQSIFSYGGTFPPSLSPFEKMYLGWIDPVEITTPKSLTLAAEAIAQNSDTLLVKIPINQSEYYLIQVRNRDANGDGSKIHYVDETGTTRQVVFTTDEDGYFNYDISALQGVIVNVDEFDWALPGSGIVIWHIDENIIRNNLESNTINNDIMHRGVAVVEADGVNDIGQSFYNIFGDLVVGEGTKDDFWFYGNNSYYYQNAFTPETQPNTDSYYGTSSGIYVTDFSSVASKMSFNVDFRGDVQIIRNFSLPLSTTSDFIVTGGDKDYNKFAIHFGYSILLYDFNGNLVKSVNMFSNIPVLLTEDGNGNATIFGALNNSLKKYSEANDSIDIIGNFNREIKKLFTTEGNDELYILTSDNDSSFIYDVNQNLIYSFGIPAKDVAAGNSFVVFNDSLLESSNFSATFQSNNKILQTAVVEVKNGSSFTEYAIILEENNIFQIVELGENGLNLSKEFEVNSSVNITAFSVILSENNEAYVSFACDGKLLAYNLEGTLVEGFPQSDNYNGKFTGYALEYNNSNDENVFVSFTETGKIFFNTFNNSSLNSQAVYSVGSVAGDGIALAKHNSQLYLLVKDALNNYYIIRKNEEIENTIWSGKFGNIKHNNFISSQIPSYSNANTATLIKAYNWPNPVSEGATHFRILTPENAEVRIKIFDLSGFKIAELNSFVTANLEKDIDWDISNISSDVYFAHVEVILTSGKKDSKIIKVAVIK